MKDELFADLLASAEEMVRIEKGEQMPMEQHVHTFSEIDVKAIREATGLKQQDFAARKLLLLLQGNPLIINLLKVV